MPVNPKMQASSKKIPQEQIKPKPKLTRVVDTRINVSPLRIYVHGNKSDFIEEQY